MFYIRFLLFSLILSATIAMPHGAMAQDQSIALPANGTFSNPCPEGEFLDLYDNVCHSLDQPQLGFDMARFLDTFNSKVVESDCNEAAFQEALALAADGGIVQIPACTFDIGRVEIPSNILIQGAGAGKTILTPSAAGGDIKLNVQDAQNVVLRDMTLDSEDGDYVMLNIERTDNLLIERMEVKSSGIMGIKFWDGVRNITIRYSKSHHHLINHGIGSKDCSTGVDIAKCPEAKWSSGYAIYSNYLHHNGTHGINLHAINGEVAGNLSEQNKYGGKFFDAQNVWVHHNTYRDNLIWGLYMAPTLRIAERTSHDLYFYNNRFLNTGAMAWGIAPGGAEVKQNASNYTNIYLIDNMYVGGKIDVQNVVVNICPGSNEAGLSILNAQDGTPAVCDRASYPSLANTPTFALQTQNPTQNVQAAAESARADDPATTPAPDVAAASSPASVITTTTGLSTAGTARAQAAWQAQASSAEMPNMAANVIDGELDTRWSAQGDGQWIQIDLGAPQLVEGIEIAWFTGAQRSANFDVLTSLDGKRWLTALDHQSSSGTTDELELYPLDALLLAARYVRIVGHGNSEQGPDGWNSIAEVNVLTQLLPAPASTNSCNRQMQSALDDGIFCFCIAGLGINTCAP